MQKGTRRRILYRMGGVQGQYRLFYIILFFYSLKLRFFFIEQTLDFNAIYDSMMKPAFVFDGRNIVTPTLLEKIGFHVEKIGRHSSQTKICVFDN